MVTISNYTPPRVIIQGQKFLRVETVAINRLKVVQSATGFQSGGNLPDDSPDFSLWFENQLI